MSDLILNTKQSFVLDSIKGTLYTAKKDNLTLLDFDNDIKVVARSDWNKDKVAVICGGGSLDAVKEAAVSASNNTASIGVALTSCSLPGQSEERIAQGKAELGLGIHGEPGIETIDLPTAKELVTTMVNKLADAKPVANTAILLNNLGGLSPIEMNIVSKEVLESDLGQQAKLVIGPAPLMTAIDMKGFSVSTIQLDDSITQALLAPVDTEAWPGTISRRELPITRCDNRIAKVTHEPSFDEHTASVLRTVCGAIINIEDELNRLDAIVGDGDTGSTFAAGARQVLEKLDAQALPLQDKAALLTTIADCLTSVMGGSSGVLLSIMLTAAGRDYETSGSLAKAFQAGLTQMMAYGGAKPGDRTMIDALSPALDAWIAQDFSAAVKAAVTGAQSTAEMVNANAGRSSYLNSDSLSGTKDPGAFAVEIVFTQLQA